MDEEAKVDETVETEEYTVHNPAPIQNRQHMLPPVYGGHTVWEVLGAGIFIGAAAIIVLSNRT